MRRLLKAVPLIALTLVCASFSQNQPAPAQCTGDSIHQMMPGHEGMGAWHGMQGMRECQPSYMHAFMVYHRWLFIAFLLVMALINIILLILVCMDMAALGKFNALWVPVLLICGIPGAALYALFRIGDQIKAAAKT